MPGCSLAAAPAAPLLIQIRRGYRADCYGLRLEVETDAEGWTARVSDRAEQRTLYSARRCSLAAAKVAAAEYAGSPFGAGCATGQASPEALARHLAWREYW